jgi:hypothetical protein
MPATNYCASSMKSWVRPVLVLGVYVILITSLRSQPFVDPIQVRYMYAVQNRKPVATPYTHLWVGSDLPVQLKGGAILLFSPYYDQWSIDSAETDNIYPTVHSLAFPLGLIMPLKNSKWTITALPVIRWNGEKLFTENTFQYGGVLLAGFQRRPEQKFRIGVYANAEFFGLFIIPLFGADWKLDDHNYIFGVLPGRLTYEHKINEKFYSGITFRAPTTSYRLSNGQYIRLDDNQLSLFVDYYLTEHFCVTLEPGLGILRKIRTGVQGRDYLTEVDWGDGPFIKLSAAYRIRL